jgi:predicted O-methyltransferase YrrM
MPRNLDQFSEVVSRVGRDPVLGKPPLIETIDLWKSALHGWVSSQVPVLAYVPERRELPPRVPRVRTAWKGNESILADLIQRFHVGSDRCLEFGVEFGYSTAALSCFFHEVTGVDRFTGDKHTVNQRDIFSETSKRLSRFRNVRLVRSDYRDWIARDDSLYDLIHIDIVHTYIDTFTCGLWSALHAPCVLFHDTLSFPDVRRAVSAIALLTGKHFYNFEESNGLGILVS